MTQNEIVKENLIQLVEDEKDVIENLENGMM